MKNQFIIVDRSHGLSPDELIMKTFGFGADELLRRIFEGNYNFILGDLSHDKHQFSNERQIGLKTNEQK